MRELAPQQQPCWPLCTCVSHQTSNTATFQSAISLGHLSVQSCAFLLLPLYLHRHDILLPVLCVGRKKSSRRVIKNAALTGRPCASTCPPTPQGGSPPPLSPLRGLHVARVDMGLIGAQTPPIFNSSIFIFICHHVSVAVHSVASPLRAASAGFPHMQASKRTQASAKDTNTCNVLAKFPALRANWLQL